MVTTTIEEKNLIDNVEKKVCKYFNVDKQAIVNNDRTSQVSMARGFIFYILHKDYELSINKIANTYFRTSRAVFWHVNKVTFLLKQRMYKEIYNNICKE
jgi:chromosomal replication initiation ATPase DnaA